MKTIIAMLLALAITFSSAFSFAKGNEAKNAPKAPQSFQVNIYKPTANALNLIVLKSKSDNIKITIKNEPGVVVLLKYTKGIESFKQKFDFSKMETGTYTIEVKKGNEVFAEEFVIN